jgi:hypothetical protein
MHRKGCYPRFKLAASHKGRYPPKAVCSFSRAPRSSDEAADFGLTHTPDRICDHRLELNEAGQIIGGAWLDEACPEFLSRKEKPDFIDVAALRFSSLTSLYQASIQASATGAKPSLAPVAE